MKLTDIVKHIESKFKIKCETKSENDSLYIKISGIDNCSLARWIRSEFNNVSVFVKGHERYKFSDEGWIIICLY